MACEKDHSFATPENMVLQGSSYLFSVLLKDLGKAALHRPAESLGLVPDIFPKRGEEYKYLSFK